MTIKTQQVVDGTAGLVVKDLIFYPKFGLPASIQVSLTGVANYEIKITNDKQVWVKLPDALNNETTSKLYPIFIPLEAITVSLTVTSGLAIVTLLEG